MAASAIKIIGDSIFLSLYNDLLHKLNAGP